MNKWDIALVIAVSLQSTLLAYIYNPKWKALLFGLPIPFTLTTLALGRNVDAANALGLAALLFYTHGVRILRTNFRLPILPSIAISALGYCGISYAVLQVLPGGNAGFWISAGLVFSLAAILFASSPHRRDQGHRTPLPVYIKLPIIVAIVMFVVAMKPVLLGFITVFPMVGMIAAYELRHSLWTLCRQIPIVMMTMLPLMAVCRIFQESLGIGASLAIGWCVFLAALAIFTRISWRKAARFEAIDLPIVAEKA